MSSIPFFLWNTNPSDAVKPPVIEPGASAERLLDIALEYTFPASDPLSIQDAYWEHD